MEPKPPASDKHEALIIAGNPLTDGAKVKRAVLIRGTSRCHGYSPHLTSLPFERPSSPYELHTNKTIYFKIYLILDNLEPVHY